MTWDYIKKDYMGFYFNSKVPPDFDKYVNPVKGYDGYDTNNRGVLFYEFAVQNYDLQFSYKGKTYYFVVGENHVALSDDRFTKEFQIFKDPMDVIEHFEIDGHKLIEIIEELEDVEPV